MQHKEQRVLVLFDVQNLYYSAKHLYNTKVNFKEILAKAVAGRMLIRAIAYVIKTDIKDEKVFHEALENMGIEVKAKDIQIFYGGAKKGDWDIGIAMDAVRLQPKVDTLVLVSGDGDFKDLLSYMKSHGCRAEVIAFSQTASRLIKEEADDFFDLSSNLNRFLIRPQHKFKQQYLPETKQQIQPARQEAAVQEEKHAAPPEIKQTSREDILKEIKKAIMPEVKAVIQEEEKKALKPLEKKIKKMKK